MLERNAEAQLDPAGTGFTVGWNELVRDHAKVLGALKAQSIRRSRQTWRDEVDVVEDVEKLRRKSKVTLS